MIRRLRDAQVLSRTRTSRSCKATRRYLRRIQRSRANFVRGNSRDLVVIAILVRLICAPGRIYTWHHWRFWKRMTFSKMWQTIWAGLNSKSRSYGSAKTASACRIISNVYFSTPIRTLKIRTMCRIHRSSVSATIPILATSWVTS